MAAVSLGEEICRPDRSWRWAVVRSFDQSHGKCSCDAESSAGVGGELLITDGRGLETLSGCGSPQNGQMPCGGSFTHEKRDQV